MKVIEKWSTEIQQGLPLAELFLNQVLPYARDNPFTEDSNVTQSAVIYLFWLLADLRDKLEDSAYAEICLECFEIVSSLPEGAAFWHNIALIYQQDREKEAVINEFLSLEPRDERQKEIMKDFLKALSKEGLIKKH